VLFRSVRLSFNVLIFKILPLSFIANDLRIAVDEQGKGTLVLNELLALPVAQLLTVFGEP
jgi:hypothetical protein